MKDRLMQCGCLHYLSVAKREILGIMSKCIAKPRASRKDNGPVVGQSFFVFVFNFTSCPLLYLTSRFFFPPFHRKYPRASFQTSSLCWSGRLQPAPAAGSNRCGEAEGRPAVER